RRRLARKRGGDLERLDLSDIGDLAAQRPDLMVELDQALDALEQLEPRQSTIVRAKFFAGLTEAEIAQAMGLSPATIKRQWRLAKAWLFRELQGLDPRGSEDDGG
ncbi:MAG: ECF-type sigma factor, partial [Acidobacteriota bacterium]